MRTTGSPDRPPQRAEIVPIAAIAIMACGVTYGFAVVMSDMTWRHITVGEIAEAPQILAELAALSSKASADILDPELCKNRTST